MFGTTCLMILLGGTVSTVGPCYRDTDECYTAQAPYEIVANRVRLCVERGTYLVLDVDRLE